MTHYVITPMPTSDAVHDAAYCFRCDSGPYQDCVIKRRTTPGQRWHKDRRKVYASIVWPYRFVHPKDRTSGFRYAHVDPYEVTGFNISIIHLDEPYREVASVFYSMRDLEWTDHRMIQLSDDCINRILKEHKLMNEVKGRTSD